MPGSTTSEGAVRPARRIRGTSSGESRLAPLVLAARLAITGRLAYRRRPHRRTLGAPVLQATERTRRHGASHTPAHRDSPLDESRWARRTPASPDSPPECRRPGSPPPAHPGRGNVGARHPGGTPSPCTSRPGRSRPARRLQRSRSWRSPPARRSRPEPFRGRELRRRRRVPAKQRYYPLRRGQRTTDHRGAVCRPDVDHAGRVYVHSPAFGRIGDLVPAKNTVWIRDGPQQPRQLASASRARHHHRGHLTPPFPRYARAPSRPHDAAPRRHHR